MPSYSATVFAAAAFFSAVSGSPIFAKRDVCGTAPTGTTSQTPLAEPTGITTAADCQSQCEANTSCQSFMFGLVDGADTCILYSVPAADVPAQTNLVAYDVSCSDVPSVVPTTSNPTGVETSGSGSSTGSGSDSGSSNRGNNGKLAIRDTCGSAPSGSTSSNTQPISTPTGITSAADCETQCKANTNCKSFTFSDDTCKLFNVAASSVPSDAGSAVYDVGCSV